MEGRPAIADSVGTMKHSFNCTQLVLLWSQAAIIDAVASVCILYVHFCRPTIPAPHHVHINKRQLLIILHLAGKVQHRSLFHTGSQLLQMIILLHQQEDIIDITAVHKRPLIGTNCVCACGKMGFVKLNFIYSLPAKSENDFF